MSKADNEILKLQAEAAALREALEEAKAYLLADVRTWNPLPKIEAVLAADAGRELLDRLRRAEKILKYGAEIADVLRQHAMNLSGFLGKQGEEEARHLETRIDFLHGLAGEIEAVAVNVMEEAA